MEYRDISIAFGKSAKFERTAEGAKVSGYLIAFGDKKQRDLQEEWFDRETELMLDDHPVIGKPVLYQHGFDDKLGVKSLGQIVNAKVDEFGLWVEAQLKLRDEYERFVAEQVEKGKIGWSSGAMPQAVTVDEQGHIKRWVIIEGSLTPTPAQPVLTTVSAKTFYKQIQKQEKAEMGISKKRLKELVGQELESIGEQIGEAIAEALNITDSEGLEVIAEVLADDAAIAEVIETVQDEVEATDMRMADEEAEAEKMTDEEYEEDARKAARKAIAKIGAKHVQSALARKRSAAKKELKGYVKYAMMDAKQQPAKGVRDTFGQSGRYTVGEERKFAHLSASDMAVGAQLLLSAARKYNPAAKLEDVVSDGYVRAMTHKAAAYADANPYKRHEANYALKSAIPFKANELNASNLVGQGLEWVGEFWSSDLWYKERYDTIYDSLVQAGMLVREVPQGASTANFPSEGSDPVAFSRPQANSTDATGRPETTAEINFFGTGVVEVSPKEVAFAVAYTDILLEDSVINVAAEVNRQSQASIMEYRDRLLINGDTATAINTNINLIDGTPASGKTAPYYLASDGLRKLPLVTATAQSRNANGSIDIDDYRNTLALLSGELRQFKQRMLFIIDPTTEMQSLAIPAIATDDVRRTNATVTSGVLENIYGVRVFTSGFLPRTNTAGKVSGTGANNVKGTILLVYAPYWGFAYKRNITLETWRDPLAGVTGVVATMRVGVMARGTNAAALSYNVGANSTI